MATLTLDASQPYTIKYTISDMMSEYVFSAVVQLFHQGSLSPIKVYTHQAIDTAYTESIIGEFIGLKPDEVYTVNSRVYNQQGQETSNRTQDIRTISIDINPNPYSKHSVIISTKNTYDEWGLIPTERPTVRPAEVKSSYVELPGSSESIDYTEILTGMVHYGQRTGTWVFYFDTEAPKFRTGKYLELKMNGRLWAYIYSELLNYTHGKVHSIVLEDEPDVVYTGRLTITGFDASSRFSRVSINYNIDPPEREIPDTLFVKLMKQSADKWNSLTNGNVDYNLRPVIPGYQMINAGWEEFDGDYATTYSSLYTEYGDYIISLTPILNNGTILSPSQLDAYAQNLNTFGDPEALLSSDNYGILIDYKAGEYDPDWWITHEQSLQYYKDQHLRAWKYIHNIKE